jgi:hypothetical protein
MFSCAAESFQLRPENDCCQRLKCPKVMRIDLNRKKTTDRDFNPELADVSSRAMVMARVQQDVEIP